MGFNLDDVKNAGELKDVWDNLHEKSWPGLLAAIQRVREEKGSDETLDKLEGTARKADSEGKPFPDSAGDLMKLITH